MTTNKTPMQIDLMASLLLAGLEYERKSGMVTPSKLGAHLCMDSFEFFNWLRAGEIIYKKAATRGSTPSLPSEESVDMGWATTEEREKSGKKYTQVLFTEAGAIEIARRIVVAPPAPLQRAMTVAKILMMAGQPEQTARSEPQNQIGRNMSAPVFKGFDS